MSWPQRRGLFTWPPQHPRVNLLLGPGQRNCDPVYPQKEAAQAGKQEREVSMKTNTDGGTDPMGAESKRVNHNPPTGVAETKAPTGTES